MSEKYIIMRLSDAKAIADHLPPGKIKDRIESETGAEVKEIAEKLKKSDFCSACVIEGQQHNCEALATRKLGRRLLRLVGRADGTWPPENHDQEVLA